MNNFETAVNATNTALLSTGSASEENAKYMESIEAKIQSLKAEFQDFANKTLNSDLIKTTVGNITNALSIINTDIGRLITTIVLFGAIITGGGVIWGTALSKTLNLYKDIYHTIFTSNGKIVKAFQSITLSIQQMSAAAKAGYPNLVKLNLLQILKPALVVAGIMAIVAAISYLINDYKKLSNSQQTYKENIEALNAELDEKWGSGSRYQDLLERQGQLTEAEREELNILIAQREEVEKRLALEKEAQYSDWYRRRNMLQPSFSTAGYSDVPTFEGQTQSEISLSELQSGVANLSSYDVNTVTGTKAKLDAIKELTAAYADEYKEIKAAIEAGREVSESDRQIVAIMEELIPQITTLDERYKEIATDANRYAQEALPNLQEEYANLNDAIEENRGVFALNAENLEAYDEYTGEAKEQIEMLLGAFQEFAETGTISAETIDAMNEKFPGLSSYLLDAAGNFDVTGASILDAIAAIYGHIEAVTQDIVVGSAFTVMMSTLKDESYDASTAIEDVAIVSGNAAGQMGVAATQAAIMAQNAYIAAGAFNTLSNAMADFGGGGRSLGEDKKSVSAESIAEKIKEATEKYKNLFKSGNNVKTGGGGSKGAGGSSKSTTDVIKEQYDAEYALLVQQYNRMEISDKEFYQKRKDLIDKYLQNHKDHDKELKSLYDDEMKWYKHLLDMGKIDEDEYYQHQQELIQNLLFGTEYYIEALWKYEEDFQKHNEQVTKETLKNQKEVLDRIADYYTTIAEENIKRLDKEIEDKNDEIEAIEKSYENRIKKREEQYKKDVEALEEQNDLLNEQIRLEELLDNLARARNTLRRVYRNGRFVYEADAEAISEAQKALDEYYREQDLEKSKEALKTELDEAVKEIKKEQIEDADLIRLENERAALESEKQLWEQFKEGWANEVKAYEQAQNKLLAMQVFGAETEAEILENRIDKLWWYAKELANITPLIDDSYSKISESIGGNSSLGISSIATSSGTSTSGVNPSVDYSAKMLSATSIGEFNHYASLRTAKANSQGIDISGNGAYMSNEQIGAIWASGTGLANGTLSASGGIHLVGENGAELRVLNRGDGIIPNSITKTLWSFGMNPSGFLGNLADKFGGSVYSFNISTLSLPNATDAQGLLTGLRNAAQQYVYQRA